MAEFLNDKRERDEALTLSQEIAAVLESIGEKYGFDRETCEEIAAKSFEEAFETAYGYLSQAGLNPDQVLAPFLEKAATDNK